MWLLTLLGIDPLSAIGKFLGALVPLIPYFIGAALIIGAYYVGHHNGVQSVDVKQYQTQINSKDAKIANLEKQYQDEVAAYNMLIKQNTNQDKKGSDAKAEIVKIIKQCDQDKTLVDTLNRVRVVQ